MTQDYGASYHRLYDFGRYMGWCWERSFRNQSIHVTYRVFIVSEGKERENCESLGACHINFDGCTEQFGVIFFLRLK